MEKQVLKGKEDDISVVVTLSTGLAIKRTTPRRVPQRYLDGPVKEVINYALRVIEQDGDSAETMLVANIQDQMASRQYVLKMNGNNVDPGMGFGKAVQTYTMIDDVGEGGQSMKYREVNFIITKVEEGGIHED